MIEFANNNNVSTFINMSSFYTNKGFYFYINFNLNIINYVIIRKRFNIIKAKNIIDYIQNVLVYIRDNLNKT